MKKFRDAERIRLLNGVVLEVFDPAPWQLKRWWWYLAGGHFEVDVFQVPTNEGVVEVTARVIEP